MYVETTRDIQIQVQPIYLDDQSETSRTEPDNGYYVWAYCVRIENQGAETVRLLNRYWNITDGHGRVQEVRGPGVVGEQPVLAPGESFEYTSGTPLSSPSGIMFGSYEMVTNDGRRFDVSIPAFSLDTPESGKRVN